MEVTLTLKIAKRNLHDHLKLYRAPMAPEPIAQENGDTNDNHEEEEEDVLVGGALRIPGDLYDKLFNYQQHCVGWMWDLHVKHVGGILGDEMGLGKTIQVIAFLSGLHHSEVAQAPNIDTMPGNSYGAVVTRAT